MGNAKITIIGGGIAGISSAVFLSEIGFKITLIESSPKLGGRISGFFDKEDNLYLDNGQHIFGGWYQNTFEFLKIINKEKRLLFQKSLSVRLIDEQKNLYNFSSSNLPVPFNLALGFLKYNALGLSDKFKSIRLFNTLRKNNFKEKFSGKNIDYVFKVFNISEKAIKYFWEPLILAVFNSIPEKVSACMFSDVIKLSLTQKSFSSLVFPLENLYDLFIENSIQYFQEKNIEVITSNSCREILINNSKVEKLILKNGVELTSDYYISAVPFFKIMELFQKEVFGSIFPGFKDLVPSTVISVYLYFENDLTFDSIPFPSYNMIGVIGKTIQWIFKIKPDIISITISASDFIGNLTEKSSEEIFTICKQELYDLFKKLELNKIRKFKVIKSKTATFIPDVKSNNKRISIQTNIDNLFVIGDWVNTGLPSTIESAVKSAKELSNYFGKIK